VERPSEADLDEMAALIAQGSNITIYAGSGCRGAHDEVMQLAERAKPRWHTPPGARIHRSTTTRTTSE
jgi:pyruvate dehydrogenase (quinone)